MNYLNRLFVIFFCISAFFYRSNAQNAVIGQWSEYLSYNNCVSVTEGNDNIIYCASKFNVFSYNNNDGSIQRYSKVSGLSDIGVSTIQFHKQLNLLCIAYTNANFDIIENGQIINISDIKRKNIIGGKNINHIFFLNNCAYLSCSFGIVVVDLIRKEIKDTYYIGPSGAHIEVFSLTCNGTDFFAATESGIFQASINNPYLANFESWTRHTNIPHFNKKFNAIVTFNNKIVANYSDTFKNKDTMFVYNGSTWNYYHVNNTNSKVSMESMHNMLITAGTNEINVYDVLDSTIVHIFGTWLFPNHAIINSNSVLWIADNYGGLIKNKDWQSIIPSGPGSFRVFDISIESGKLWVAPGGIDNSWSNLYHADGVFSFIDGKWSTYNVYASNKIYDVSFVIVNPSNPNNVYAASWNCGLLEFNNSILTNIYDENNSSLSTLSPNNSCIRIGGFAFDNDNNLWVTNTGVVKALSIKKTNNTWKSFDFTGFVTDNVVGNMIIDSYNQKWIILPKDGIIVFNDNNTIDNTNDDKVKKLNSAQGNGALPGDVLSLAIDQEGKIWVGTDKGIVVFYSPKNVFSELNFDAQPITVMLDGRAQHLLETESVNTIVIDGANQKWIGTQNAGVFLMSSDGTQQLQHFTEDNSPLFSNTIISIAIDHLTGEVFFGTDKGIVSYVGEATAGGKQFSNVYAYPNPVRENYNGPIGIKGLTTNADVKITDIAGNLIYETVAKGGQAIWNGKNFNGEKAKTGVYLVFCSNQNGEEKIVTKIMLIN